MRMEYQKGLLQGSDLEGIRAGLMAECDREHKRLIKVIERDHLTAKLILQGLQEPQTSGAYQMARSFMDDFQNAQGQKEKPNPRTAEIMRLLRGDGSELKIDDDAEGGVTDGTAEPGKVD